MGAKFTNSPSIIDSIFCTSSSILSVMTGFCAEGSFNKGFCGEGSGGGIVNSSDNETREFRRRVLFE